MLVHNILQEAIAHHQAGRLSRAETLCRQILQAEPNHFDALHFLGIIALQSGDIEGAAKLIGMAVHANPSNPLCQFNLGVTLQAQGRQDAAIEHYRKALLLNPNYAEAHNNLALALRDQGKLELAIKHFRNALALQPSYANVHNNLGAALFDQDELDAAAECFRHALSLQQEYAEAHYNLGRVFRDQGQFEAAAASYRRAIAIKPDYAEAYSDLGVAFKDQGRLDEALACFQQLIKLTPESDSARHLLASLTGDNTERAPARYVEGLFDCYANKFEKHLVQGLKYDVPEKLVALVAQHATPPAGKWNVLDLGCGTGLVGAAMAPFARQLAGVDLSARMLEKARARNIYQRLVRSDLLEMLREEPDADYDVILAADVFIYIGKLDEIVGEIKRLLRPNGMFAFSIENPETSSDEGANPDSQREYQLQNTGRYAQSAQYMSRLATENGFSLQKMAATQIRMEGSKPILGHLVLWKSREGGGA